MYLYSMLQSTQLLSYSYTYQVIVISQYKYIASLVPKIFNNEDCYYSHACLLRKITRGGVNNMRIVILVGIREEVPLA